MMQSMDSWREEPHPADPDPDLLVGWKEIAAYFRRDKRTVQMWESRGFPVRRNPAGGVYMHRREAREWLDSENGAAITIEPHRRGSWVAGVSVIAGAILIATMLLGRARVPAEHHLTSQALEVTDRSGRLTWRHEFPLGFHANRYEVHRNAVPSPFKILHLPGRNEVNAYFVYDPRPLESTGSTLYCFDARGGIDWTFRPGREVRSPHERSPGVFVVSDFVTAPASDGRRPWILVNSHHLTTFPNQLVSLDHRGTVVEEYWHSGHLEHMLTADLDNDGAPEILLGGVNNGYEAAVLVVLPGSGFGGASRQRRGREFQILSFPEAREKAVVVFPRSCLNLAETFSKVRLLGFPAGNIKVNVQHMEGDDQCEVVYMLDRHLRLISAYPSNRFHYHHRELESQGAIDHSLADERKRLEQIEVWR